MIVTGSTDGTVRLWNPKSGECVHVFRGHGFHEGPVTFLACHPSVSCFNVYLYIWANLVPYSFTSPRPLS